MDRPDDAHWSDSGDDGDRLEEEVRLYSLVHHSCDTFDDDVPLINDVFVPTPASIPTRTTVSTRNTDDTSETSGLVQYGTSFRSKANRLDNVKKIIFNSDSKLGNSVPKVPPRKADDAVTSETSGFVQYQASVGSKAKSPDNLKKIVLNFDRVGVNCTEQVAKRALKKSQLARKKERVKKLKTAKRNHKMILMEEAANIANTSYSDSPNVSTLNGKPPSLYFENLRNDLSNVDALTLVDSVEAPTSNVPGKNTNVSETTKPLCPNQSVQMERRKNRAMVVVSPPTVELCTSSDASHDATTPKIPVSKRVDVQSEMSAEQSYRSNDRGHLNRPRPKSAPIVAVAVGWEHLSTNPYEGSFNASYVDESANSGRRKSRSKTKSPVTFDVVNSTPIEPWEKGKKPWEKASRPRLFHDGADTAIGDVWYPEENRRPRSTPQRPPFTFDLAAHGIAVPPAAAPRSLFFSDAVPPHGRAAPEKTFRLDNSMFRTTPGVPAVDPEISRLERNLITNMTSFETNDIRHLEECLLRSLPETPALRPSAKERLGPVVRDVIAPQNVALPPLRTRAKDRLGPVASDLQPVRGRPRDRLGPVATSDTIGEVPRQRTKIRDRLGPVVANDVPVIPTLFEALGVPSGQPDVYNELTDTRIIRTIPSLFDLRVELPLKVSSILDDTVPELSEVIGLPVVKSNAGQNTGLGMLPSPGVVQNAQTDAGLSKKRISVKDRLGPKASVVANIVTNTVTNAATIANGATNVVGNGSTNVERPRRRPKAADWFEPSETDISDAVAGLPTCSSSEMNDRTELVEKSVTSVPIEQSLNAPVEQAIVSENHGTERDVRTPKNRTAKAKARMRTPKNAVADDVNEGRVDVRSTKKVVLEAVDDSATEEERPNVRSTKKVVLEAVDDSATEEERPNIRSTKTVVLEAVDDSATEEERPNVRSTKKVVLEAVDDSATEEEGPNVRSTKRIELEAVDDSATEEERSNVRSTKNGIPETEDGTVTDDVSSANSKSRNTLEKNHSDSSFLSLVVHEPEPVEINVDDVVLLNEYVNLDDKNIILLDDEDDDDNPVVISDDEDGESSSDDSVIVVPLPSRPEPVVIAVDDSSDESQMTPLQEDIPRRGDKVETVGGDSSDENLSTLRRNAIASSQDKVEDVVENSFDFLDSSFDVDVLAKTQATLLSRLNSNHGSKESLLDERLFQVEPTTMPNQDDNVSSSTTSGKRRARPKSPDVDKIMEYIDSYTRRAKPSPKRRRNDGRASSASVESSEEKPTKRDGAFLKPDSPRRILSKGERAAPGNAGAARPETVNLEEEPGDDDLVAVHSGNKVDDSLEEIMAGGTPGRRGKRGREAREARGTMQASASKRSRLSAPEPHPRPADIEYTAIAGGDLVDVEPALHPATWTREMCAFYDKSWGGEHFSYRDMQRKMPSNPRLWGSTYDPRNGPPPTRRIRCSGCLHSGHLLHECPRQGRPVCHMCGVTGHQHSRCPSSVCLRCGQPNTRFTDRCQVCANSAFDSCMNCVWLHDPSQMCHQPIQRSRSSQRPRTSKQKSPGGYNPYRFHKRNHSR